MQKEKEIYIAGKVSGEPKHDCFAKFKTIEKELELQGFIVHNPLEIIGNIKADWHTAMEKCIQFIIEKQPEMYFLADWRLSRGAKIEHLIAKSLNLKITYQKI